MNILDPTAASSHLLSGFKTNKNYSSIAKLSPNPAGSSGIINLRNKNNNS